MRLAYIILTVVVLLVLAGLFGYRASQTTAYTSTVGKPAVVDESKYSQEYLYKGRQASTPVLIDSLKNEAAAKAAARAGAGAGK